MKPLFYCIVISIFLLLSSHASLGLPNADLISLFEKEITRSTSYDSLGSLKGSIEFSISLNTIENDRYVKELNENPKEAFYIKVDRNSIQIVAENYTALEHGIFYYLHHLGFRYYFANPNWHYFPELNTIFRPIEGVFGPDYLNRRIRYNYGTGSTKASADFNFWQKANLLGESIPGFTGHAYGQIIKRNRKTFHEHPEYFAQTVKKGEIPKDPKFDISNSDLVELVVEDALKLAKTYYEKYGPKFIISMDPSDGGGYCNKPSCGPWKSVSDQVYYLANEVAKKLALHYPKAHVGLYAYNLHAAPPSFNLHENIVIYIATSFNKSKFNYTELIQEWMNKVKYIGIRDYYGVINWDWDLPGKGKGTQPNQIHKSLKKYYNNQNVRFYYIETLNGWITKGLGHYIAARTLWDISINPAKEIEEFYSSMFPASQKIMEPLLKQLMHYSRDIPLDKDLDEWIKNIRTAHTEAVTASEKYRIEDVMQYLYALILYVKKDRDDVKSYKELFQFLHQINDNSNYASYAMRRMMFGTFKEIMPETIIKTRGSAMNYNSSTSINYIKALDSVQKSLKPLHWTPYNFDLKNLEFEEIKILTSRSRGGKPIVFRENHMFLINVNHKSRIGVQEGIVNYKNLKGGILHLFAYEDKEFKNSLYNFQLTPDTITNIKFSDIDPGKYWMKIQDNREGFKLISKVNCRISIYQDKDYPLNTFYRNSFYFNVPEEVNNFLLRKVGSATLISPAGRIINFQEYGRTDELIKKEENETGYWRVENQKGSFFIEGIPPFFATKKDDLPNFKKKECFLKFWK